MVDEPIVSTLWLRTVAEYLNEIGTDPSPVLAHFDLSSDCLADNDSWHPLATFIGMQEEAAALTGDPYFGVRMGLAYEPRQGGPLGYSMMHAPSVRDSLHMLVRYQGMHLRGAALRLSEDDEQARLSYRVDDQTLRPRVQDGLAAVATGIKMVRHLGFPDWKPTCVRLEQAAREGDDVIAEFFDTKVQFGQPTNAIVLDRALLDEPVHGADTGLGSILERHLGLLAQRPPKLAALIDTLVSNVREAVAAQIQTGEPSLEQTAKSLGMSSRTLQRELRKRATAFREVVEALRHDLALEYIREKDVAITQIAFMLGYSELSAFDRAFRRWTGVTPQAHRRQVFA